MPEEDKNGCNISQRHSPVTQIFRVEDMEDILPDGGFISTLSMEWELISHRDQKRNKRLFRVIHQEQPVSVKEVTEKIKRKVFNATVVPRLKVLLNLKHRNIAQHCGLALVKPREPCYEGYLCHLTASHYYPGLHYLHAQCGDETQVFHCDIKPENLVLAHPDVPDRRVVIIDLEGAAVSQNGELNSETTNTYCTLRYAPPELLFCTALSNAEEGKICDKTDIWSVGCVAIYLATGKKPMVCEWKSNTGPGTQEWDDYSYGEECRGPSVVCHVGGLTGKPKLPELSDSETDQRLLNFIKSCLIFDYALRKTAAELLRDVYLTSIVQE
ncbi:uncharacterized protein LOC129599252 isoform X2 [Paramacrobiotus metropolitanus]|nr:uncharacterized protein LOC129599252 isoform X2 [Paramacrobiotus metropolitanus]